MHLKLVSALAFVALVAASPDAPHPPGKKVAYPHKHHSPPPPPTTAPDHRKIHLSRANFADIPGNTGPGNTGPGKTNPGKTEPGKTEPGKTNPNPGKTTPGKTNPGKIAPPFPGNPPPTIDVSKCSKGHLQCCKSAPMPTAPEVAPLLSPFNIPASSVSGLVGVTCTAIPDGAKYCSDKPLCCTDNSFGGHVALGCNMVNLKM